ncbi:hypothetical protein K525DRAFT_246611 [Schizophyllum commune Loenen D]|nr:hypothetical protein K525DRAFT_246611 [Schizophyllum commune Loenen D]
MVPSTLSTDLRLLAFEEAQEMQSSLLFAPLIVNEEDLRNTIEGQEVAIEIIPLGMSRRVKDAAMTMAIADNQDVDRGMPVPGSPPALGVAHGLGVAAALGAAPILGVNAFVPGVAVGAHSVAPGMHFMGGSFPAMSLRSPRASIARRGSLVPSPPLSPVSASFA